MYIAAAYMNTFNANIHCNWPIELLYLMVNVFYILPGVKLRVYCIYINITIYILKFHCKYMAIKFIS